MNPTEKSRIRLEAHDVAGYESDFIEWDAWDDGYGSNVMWGDNSVGRMIERGAREPWHTTTSGDEGFGTAQAPSAYDTEPFQSEAQRRKFHAMAARGEISESTVSRWEHETPKGKKLPYHKR